MKRFLKLSVLALSAVSIAGCAVPVYDNHQEDPPPFWWPAFMYKPTTRPSQEEYDQTRNYPTKDAPDADFAGNGGGAWIDPVAGTATRSAAGTATADAAGPQHDVRAEWNLAYAQHPIIVNTAESPAVPSVNPAASTVYPNRGQAALASGSATLYPPTNEFTGGPTRTASVYPHGPLAPTGYIGR